MARTGVRGLRVAAVVALVFSGLMAVVGTSPATADVSAVKGSACAYFANVSLFGGPSMLRGCGQPGDAPAAGAAPSVTLPTTGSSAPVAATDDDGATAQYGPAKLFSGQYPSNDTNATSPPSGPLSASTQGTTGPTGSVASSAGVGMGAQPPPGLPAQPRGVGPSPVIADALTSSCTASEAGRSGSTSLTNGILVLSTKPDGDILTSEPVPASPPANYTRTGTLDNLGDSFRVVYNEQITNSDGSLTVNGVHLSLLGPTALGEVVIAQSVCGVTVVAATTTTSGATTTTVGGTTTTVGGTTTTLGGTTTSSTTSTTASSTTTTGAGATTTTAGGSGGAVSGGACGYFANVGLFGGPQNLRGCGQPASAPATNASPSVALPAAGSASPITGSDPDGATAEYGPAKLFSGRNPADPNAPVPPSGPMLVSTQGTPGGTVTSSASITLPRGVGPGPIVADGVSSTCSASASGLSGSTTITAGILVTSTTADGTALDSQPVPVNPPASYTRTGVITNVGDSFRVVYNEQILGSDGSITVNAVHLTLLGPTAAGELVIAQSRCGRTAGTGPGTGGGTGSTGGGGGLSNTGTNALRLVAFAMLFVVIGAHVRQVSMQLQWSEPLPSGGRRHMFPRRRGHVRRTPRKRPWD